MAVYSAERRYIFFANPQTASKAIALTLREKLGGVSIPEREVTRSGKVVARVHHTTYSQMLAARLMTEDELHGLFKFTCVRNPFDQLVSKYIKHCERLTHNPARYPWLEGVPATSPENSFPQWLSFLSERYGERDKLAKGPLEFLNHADHVIRFEALQEGFEAFLRYIGVTDPLAIGEFNITRGRAEVSEASGAAGTAKATKRKYTEYYDARTIALAERMFEPVLQRFNYRFGD